jgi:hypothetical protein
MPITYEPIATAAWSGTVTFSSIPSTYTDLRVVVAGSNFVGQNIAIRFNNDAGNNYFGVNVRGNGTSALGQTVNSTDRCQPPNWQTQGTTPALVIFDIFSYAGSSAKGILINANADNNGAGDVVRSSNCWNSTAAINRIDVFSGSGGNGGTVTLYGIKAA